MLNIPATAFEDTGDLRREVIATCLLMHDDLGYFISTWGNISVRLADGLLVTPTRIGYEELRPEDLVVISWRGERLKGERLPTSEVELHRQILLERPDFAAIIHHHGPWTTVCACAQRTIPVIADDIAEIIGGPVFCSRHVAAGRHHELAEAARRAIGRDATAVLLANHGALVGARTLTEAIAACQVLEKAAMALVHAEALGGAKPIGEALWREERERYLYRYGKAEDLAGVIKSKMD
jgi:L-fuculose-phosphate aldolase